MPRIQLLPTNPATFSVPSKVGGLGARLTLGANHAQSDGFALALRELQPGLLRLCASLEGFGQRREFTSDIFKEQPFFCDFHTQFISRLLLPRLLENDFLAIVERTWRDARKGARKATGAFTGYRPTPRPATVGRPALQRQATSPQ